MAASPNRTCLVVDVHDVFEVEHRHGHFYVVAKTQNGGRSDVVGPLINEGAAYEIVGRMWDVLRTWIA